MTAMHHPHKAPKIWAALCGTPTICVLVVASTSFSPNPSCVPTLDLLASMVTEVKSQIFGTVPLIRTPPVLVLKVVLVSYSQNPRCITNFKSLDSTVAKISRGSQFFWMPLAQTPANFVPKPFSQ